MTLVNDQLVKRNSYGAPVLHYDAIDSLRWDGIYSYDVIAIQRETLIPFSLATKEVTFEKPKTKLPHSIQQRTVIIPLHYPDRISLQIFVYDRATDLKLLTSKQVFDPLQDKSIEINLGDPLDDGIKQFLIIISDGMAKRALEFYYSVNQAGALVKQ